MIVIYFLENTINGKFYVGQTDNLARRLTQHRNPKARWRGRRVQKAVNKHGWQAFRWGVLTDGLASREQADAIERFWIGCLGTLRKGYNAQLPNGGFNEETMRRLRAPKPPEWAAKISAALKGRRKTPEEKAAMSAAAKKRVARGTHACCDHERQRAISKLPRNYPNISCPHCGTAGASNLMRRYHFDKCKTRAA